MKTFAIILNQLDREFLAIHASDLKEAIIASVARVA